MWTAARVRMVEAVREFCRGNRGQDLLEYGLLASLIAVGAIAAVSQVGDRIASLWQVIKDGF